MNNMNHIQTIISYLRYSKEKMVIYYRIYDIVNMIIKERKHKKNEMFFN